jgi:hypothetical protein
VAIDACTDMDRTVQELAPLPVLALSRAAPTGTTLTMSTRGIQRYMETSIGDDYHIVRIGWRVPTMTETLRAGLSLRSMETMITNQGESVMLTSGLRLRSFHGELAALRVY